MAIEMKMAKVKMNNRSILACQYQILAKHLCMNFGMIKLNQSMNRVALNGVAVKAKAKLCYMNTDSFVIRIKTEDFYEDTANDVKKWFDTSNYDENDKRPLPIGKNKKYLCLKIIKIDFLMIKSYQNYKKDLKVIIIMYILNKSIKLVIML